MKGYVNREDILKFDIDDEILKKIFIDDEEKYNLFINGDNNDKFRIINELVYDNIDLSQYGVESLKCDFNDDGCHSLGVIGGPIEDLFDRFGEEINGGVEDLDIVDYILDAIILEEDGTVNYDKSILRNEIEINDNVEQAESILLKYIRDKIINVMSNKNYLIVIYYHR